MAIERCTKCDIWWDRDWHTECPKCTGMKVTQAIGGEHVVSFANRMCRLAATSTDPFFAVHNARAMYVTPEIKASFLVDEWDKIGMAMSEGRRQSIPISDERSDLIRKLMDRFPFDASTRGLYDECKRVLGEA